MQELINLLSEGRKSLIVLAIAIVLDIVSGVIKASLNHDLKSSEFRMGLMKKVLDFILVIVAYSLDWLLGVNYIGTATLYFLVAMEFYSVLENIRDYIPLPDIIEKVLNQLQGKGEGEK